MLATVWLNGGEGQLILSLVGMSWYANYSYIGEHDEASAAECFRRACLVDYGTLKQTMRVEYPHGGEYAFSRALLYNDPLTGMMDAHIKGLDARSYYKDLTRDLSSFEGLGEFSFSVETVRALSSLLEDKSDFGIRLTEAYKSRDREALASLATECDLIADKVMALRDANRVSWMRYCKPFGWEVLDVRYGGIRARFETARSRILAFLAGEISSIEELEEERLRFDCIENCETRDSGRFNWYRFGEIYTAGIR